jgi:molecular chaperone DnaK
MTNALHDYLLRQGLTVVESSLGSVVGQPSSAVSNEAHYRQHVIRKGWESLPSAIRLLIGKHYPLWDALYIGLRHQAYDLSKGVVELRGDAPVKIGALMERFLTSIEGPRVHVPPEPRPAAAEPKPPKPEAPQVAIGIDLGTTYSLVAFVDAQGRPNCIANSAGDLLTPSVVLFDEGGTVVGKEAVQASAMEPDKVADFVKRDMGAKVYRKKINGEHLPPEVISSMILRSLRADAERRLGSVKKAVITVPAYFEDTRRRATLDAGKLAGLDVLDIINEPTAAAIAFGYQLGFLDRAGQTAEGQTLRVLVYDLGGGTFDVTILEIHGKAFKALATDGDVGLGGKDWDDQLVELAAERFRQQYREDPRSNPLSLQELRLAAESAKRTLTERSRATLYINHLGSRLKIEISREEFEEATAPLVERTRMTCELVVRQAKLEWSAIDRVLLVGGSTRMPMIGRMLQELTAKEPDRSISADEAVAHGAALYAELLCPRQGEATADEEPRFSVENVNSHSLGILGKQPETGRKRNKILIPKNSPLPRTVSKVFRTFKPNQRSVVIQVLEGESEQTDGCTQIGVCAITDLPPDLPEGWPVQVSYTYEANGRLQVSAKVKGHEAGVSTEFHRENSLPDEDLELWSEYVREETRKRR